MEHRFRGEKESRPRKKNFCRTGRRGILHPALPRREKNDTETYETRKAENDGEDEKGE